MYSSTKKDRKYYIAKNRLYQCTEKLYCKTRWCQTPILGGEKGGGGGIESQTNFGGEGANKANQFSFDRASYSMFLVFDSLRFFYQTINIRVLSNVKT